MSATVKPLMPAISIVIPTFNRSEKLKRALESIVAQTFSNWEVVVVDNHSTDDTNNMLKEFKEYPIRIYKIRNNGIIASSRNLGIRKSTGDWIAFLDSDDWWHANKLETVVDNLSSKCDFYYHDLQIIKSQARFKIYKKNINSNQIKSPIYSNLIKYGNVIANSSVVVRRSLILKIDGLSENPKLVASEDFDCWIRLSKISDNFKYIPEILGFYEINKANTSSAQLSLIHLEYINALHVNPFILKHGIESPIWLQYSFARALYKTNKIKKSLKILQKLINRNLSWSMRIKVLFMLIASISKIMLTILKGK
jgi:glycosyltransferase involved in cell wall biosynthesis